MRMLLIGCGEMGGALLEGWHDAKGMSEISILTPRQESIPKKCRSYTWYASSKDIQQASFDILFIAVKPSLVLDVLGQCRPLLKSSGLICSVAAGLPASAYGPGHVVRFMPNLPVKIRQGITVLYGSKGIPSSLRDIVTKLAESVGSAYWVEEELLFNKMTVLASCGVGYVLEIMAAYSSIVASAGISSDVAGKIVQDLFSGVVSYSQEMSESFDSLAHKLGGEGSLTLSGLEIFRRDDSMVSLLQKAVTASLERGAEVAKTGQGIHDDSTSQCDADH